MTRLTRRRMFMALPVAGATLAGLGCWKMLAAMQDGSFDPHAIRNDQASETIPDFSLPGLSGQSDGFSTADLRASPVPVLVNFFASWCIPCVAEMAALRVISRDIALWGIAYKDKPQDARRFIERDGSPYARTGLDESGMTAIDWGVTGVPESFLVMPGGHIAWHGAAALDEALLDHTILPLAAQASAPSTGDGRSE
ncbi:MULTISPECIES: redoxin domain-containing protein [Asaia]|uniref:Cytochrome c-type biogenesis protein CcmG/DsbE,thiol:disulfide oxidoreductase n=1 Tax=Asaia bogorensis TaxID=91915 RepID=A0A060QGV1_9PROT|nr:MULTISPECIES: redoxin domain-containing protein [Asaia]ETC99625.1 cytochrome C biogenesis protein [Asaia sp. SF2.1]CDG38491.1 Cytochrome c-type biogenesis protein CcmG/DsbE,thiol:disulfide oxidoreductase [Asaia bogorensis]